MQAATQYQGEASNHELAAILDTEAIQHSKFVTKRPIFLLFLDIKSAFDVYRLLTWHNILVLAQANKIFQFETRDRIF